MSEMLFGAPTLGVAGVMDRTMAGMLVEMALLLKSSGKRICLAEARFTDHRVMVVLVVVGAQYFVLCMN